MERKPKTIYQLDTPFTQVEWPKILDSDQTHIFELLCSTLKPIGLHRTNHVTLSKGKRSQKRKRQEARSKATSSLDSDILEAPPPPPEIQNHVVVGLNSILRHLQASSQKSKPGQGTQDGSNEATERVEDNPGISGDLEHPGHFAAIFALPTSPPNILTTHLPTLINNASISHPSLPPTRLIPLSVSQTNQLATILTLGRISHIGILDSAPAEGLLKMVRETVSEIEVKWLDEVEKGKYLGVKINAVETFIRISRKEKRKDLTERENMNEDEIEVEGSRGGV